MTTALDTIRYHSGIAGEEVADMVDSLEREVFTLREKVENLKEELFNSDRKVENCQQERREIREQVAALTKERDAAWSVNPTVSENLLREQLAALAEQNEKMRETLLYSKKLQDFSKTVATGAQDRELAKMEPILYKQTVEALSLPDLASPVLNKYRAEGMRMSAEICEELARQATQAMEQHSGILSGEYAQAYTYAETDILAKAAELEKTNG